jgi:hypothetical protein
VDEDEDDALSYFQRLAEEWLRIKSDIISSFKGFSLILTGTFFILH